MAKARRSRKSSPPRRSWAIALLAISAILGALFYLYGAPLVGNAKVATAYSARIGCSCRFVAERDLADCEKDMLAGMEFVSLSEDVEAMTVTASVPFVASDTASLRDGFGCVLQPWQREG